MRPLLAIPLTIALFGCQDASKVSPCQPDGQAVYRYEDRSSGEQMSVIREGNGLLFDFHVPDADYQPSKISAKILEADGFFQIMNLLVPKDLSGNSVSNATTECHSRSDNSDVTLYHIICEKSNEETSEIVLFDIRKGIVEWSTVNEDGSKNSEYLLRSDNGLLHACPA